MKKIKLLIAAAAVFGLAANGFTQQTVENLLQGYLKNDLELQSLSAEVEKQILTKESTYISNGWNFKISTGTVTLYTGDTTYATMNPDASFTLPQYNGLNVTLSSNIQVGDGTSTSAGVSNTALGVGADILSSKADTVKINLLKADRTLLETQRKLQNRFTEAEKEFYTELKALYQIDVEIVKAEKDLYEDQIDFNTVKAQGYGANSSKYRTAQMDVLSDQHTVDTAKHKLEREVKIFAAKCGVTYDGDDAEAFLPTSIPSVDAIDVLSFSEDTYNEIESATWTAYINQLTRDSEKYFTLAANAGYTFKNSKTNSDTLNLGTSLTLADSGLTANAGVSIPTVSQNDTHNPVFTFGVSLDPTAFSKAKLSTEIDEQSAKQEQLTIDNARTSYQTAVTTQQASLSDIQWNKQTNTESYDMYKSLASDMKSWYNRGITTESEWRSAEVNKENYRIQLIMNDIDLIIYNDETTLMFRRDEELNHERPDKKPEDRPAEVTEETQAE